MRDVTVLSSTQMKSIQGLMGETLDQSVLSTVELQRMKDTASGEIERRAAAARNLEQANKAEGLATVRRALDTVPPRARARGRHLSTVTVRAQTSAPRLTQQLCTPSPPRRRPRRASSAWPSWRCSGRPRCRSQTSSRPSLRPRPRQAWPGTKVGRRSGRTARAARGCLRGRLRGRLRGCLRGLAKGLGWRWVVGVGWGGARTPRGAWASRAPHPLPGRRGGAAAR